VARALPDVRDGLKPVQRRILYAMHDLGLAPDRPYRKSARLVGEVLGKYHPHGDSAVYDAMVRLAQDFTMRYPLVDGQGNFGSIDGDGAAAQRYTEARLAPIAREILADIDKNTVDFIDNFDASLTEPSVLPAALPNLLVNGASGIAVGMATNIPPHNLVEICDALGHLIDNFDRAEEVTVDELLQHVKGPDFQTGALIMGEAGIAAAYGTGKGRIIMRAVTEIEEFRKDRYAIVATEIPYQVNKAALIEKIAELHRTGRVDAISDLRDESGREQLVRLVIPLKKDANVQVTINQLWQYTPLESHLHAINVVLVNRVPRTLGLKQLIEHFVRHRVEVIRRRTQFLLRKARQRAHVLEGLILAVADIDEIIRLIRESPNADVARQRLMEKNLRLSEAATVRALLPAVFVAKATAADQRLTHTQADAILAMQLRRLTGLEIEQLAAEYTKLVEEIADYELILSDERRVLDIICEDMRELKEKLGEQRRTQIGGDVGTLELDELIAQEDVVVTISHEGYIKRVPIDTYRSQGRGGKGIRGTEARDGDFIEHLRVASTHDYLLFFTNRGRVYWLRVYDIPSMQRTSRGRALANVLTLQPNERHVAVLSVSQFEEQYAFFATEKGIVKKTPLRAFSNPRPSGIIAMSLDLDDSLIKVSLSNGAQQIVLGTRNGMACRFNEDEVRPMGRSARGVRGIALTGDDRVIDMVVIEPGMSLLTVCENGYGKRTDIEEYRLTHRGSKGVINIRTTERNGPVIAMRAVTDENDLMLITAKGTLLRMPMSDLREIGRATQGVRLIRVDEDDRVVAIARVVSEKEENAINGLSPAGEGADKSADILTQTPAANAAAAGNGEVREPDDVEPEAPAESDEAGENGDSEPQA